MKITFTDYRLGIVVGAIVAWGFSAIFEGMEVLLFGELLIPWTTQNAAVSVGVGVIYLVFAYLIHRWVMTLQRIAEVSGEVENE
jgi:hypothetical protein